MTDATGVAADQLKAFVERIERLSESKDEITSDIRDVYEEAKGNGFDKKALREVVRLRKLDRNEREEREALVDLYRSAIGL